MRTGSLALLVALGAGPLLLTRSNPTERQDSTAFALIERRIAALELQSMARTERGSRILAKSEGAALVLDLPAAAGGRQRAATKIVVALVPDEQEWDGARYVIGRKGVDDVALAMVLTSGLVHVGVKRKGEQVYDLTGVQDGAYDLVVTWDEHDDFGTRKIVNAARVNVTEGAWTGPRIEKVGQTEWSPNLGYGWEPR